MKKINWITFLSENKSKEYLSNTGITFKICEDWYLSKNEDEQRSIVKKICKILSDENVAHDINGYAKAPPSFRVWAGGTVEPANIELLLPWLDWAYSEVKKFMPKVLISDAMDDIAEKILLSNNIEVDVITNFTPDELNQNIISYDGLIVVQQLKVKRSNRKCKKFKGGW